MCDFDYERQKSLRATPVGEPGTDEETDVDEQ